MNAGEARALIDELVNRKANIHMPSLRNPEMSIAEETKLLSQSLEGFMDHEHIGVLTDSFRNFQYVYKLGGLSQ